MLLPNIIHDFFPCHDSAFFLQKQVQQSVNDRAENDLGSFVIFLPQCAIVDTKVNTILNDKKHNRSFPSIQKPFGLL